MGVAHVIRDRLFADPEFCALRGTGRDIDDPGSLYGAKMAKTINHLTGGKLYSRGIQRGHTLLLIPVKPAKCSRLP